jgi:hypothetical protein
LGASTSSGREPSYRVDAGSHPACQLNGGDLSIDPHTADENGFASFPLECIIEASQAEGGGFLAAEPVTRTLTVERAIIKLAPPEETVLDAKTVRVVIKEPTQLASDIMYTESGPCAVEQGVTDGEKTYFTITGTATGTCTVNFSANGDLVGTAFEPGDDLVWTHEFE